jgi:hypothetical protein
MGGRVKFFELASKTGPLVNFSWGKLQKKICRKPRCPTRPSELRGEPVGAELATAEVTSISVQGQDANYAWKGAAHLACELNIPVAAEFVWKDKPGAAHPGVIGRLTA